MTTPPEVFNAEALSDVIRAECTAHAERALGCECMIDSGPLSIQWRELDLRQIASQELTIWRRLTELQVLMDPEGSVVGFVDSGAWTGCAESALDDESVHALLLATGCIPAGAWWRSRSVGPRGEIVIELVAAGRAVRAVVNGARRSVIAIRPMELA